MLLKQLLESPKNSSKLLVYDPFREYDQEELVKEVIGLANADVDGPRNILFGVNAAAIEGSGIVGIAESDMADLKKAHRLLSELVEPVLHLAFIYDRINGKLVGTLEIDGCDDGPYVVAKDFSDALSQGRCWVREGYVLRDVESADLAQRSTPEPAEEPTRTTEPPRIAVGFNDDPDCQLLEMPVPDTSNPPFALEKQKAGRSSEIGKAIKETIGTVTTRILSLGRPRPQESAADLGESDMATQFEESEEAGKLISDADNHYFFEEKALKLNLCVCNKGSEGIKDVSVELGLPRTPDFDVADRLYISPFDKRSEYEIRKLGYPEVNRRADSVRVRSSIGYLAPDSPEQAFKSALRLAVGPGMQRRKMAVLYKVRGPDGKKLCKGRLKIAFGPVSA